MNNRNQTEAPNAPPETDTVCQGERPDFHSRHLKILYTFTAIFSAVTIGLDARESIPARLRIDFLISLPVLLILANAIWLRFYRPLKRRIYIHLLCCNLLLFALVWLSSQNLLRWTVLMAVAIVLRFAIVGGWALSTAGVALVVEGIRRRTFTWHLVAARCSRFCIPILFMTVCLESAAYLLQPIWQPDQPLPKFELSQTNDNKTIAAIGGSTMLGFPYAPEYGIVSASGHLLKHAYPSHDIRLKNLAVTGINLPRAISSLRALTQKPDLIVVYSGHNEFFFDFREMADIRKTRFRFIDDLLSYSPVFNIIDPIVSQYLLIVIGPEGVTGLIRNRGCPEPLAEKRLQRYVTQLNYLFDWASEYGINVVYCVPTSDEADFEPNQSRCDNCSKNDRALVEEQWQEIKRLLNAGQHEEALSACETAIQRFHGVAELHYRKAQCLHRLERFDEAQRQYSVARDLDDRPARASSFYTAAGTQAAVEAGVAVIDCPEILRAHTNDGILTSQFFLDGVHPNLHASFILGRELAAEVCRQNLLGIDQAPQPMRDSFEESLKDHGVTRQTLVRAYATTSEVLTHYRTFRRYDDKKRIADAARFKRLSERLATQEIAPGEAGAESLSQSESPASSSPASADPM